MKYTLAGMLGAAAVMVLTSTAPYAAERDISGTYDMEGTSLRPNSRGYSGTCKLAKVAKIYQVNCVNTGSGDKYVGKGILTGNLFSLYLGEYLVVYHVKTDGQLEGNWTHSRSDDYGREVLKPQKTAKAPKK